MMFGLRLEDDVIPYLDAPTHPKKMPMDEMPCGHMTVQSQ